MPKRRPRVQRQRRPRSQTCIVCGEATVGQSPLCSRTCVRAAHDELESNAAAFHQAPSDERAELAARNGVLTAALIRWHPD